MESTPTPPGKASPQQVGGGGLRLCQPTRCHLPLQKRKARVGRARKPWDSHFLSSPESGERRENNPAKSQCLVPPPKALPGPQS